MNKKGFTLIELLAVIIILGILMIIAIPSVTRYISDSRKNAYVDTAKEIVGGARNIVNGGKLEMYATDTTYYIPVSCIKTENAQKSPYGDFTKAYVGVIYDGFGYKYYWISVDDAGQGVSKITPLDKLDIDDIESDLKDSDIEGVVQTTGIGERNEIKILNCNTNTWDKQYQLNDTSGNVSEDSGGSSSTMKCVGNDCVCKKATSLHTSECNATDGGCYDAGYVPGSAYYTQNTSTITYGTIPNGTPKAGDAYDCDVNGDGIYNSQNERFYYITSSNGKSILLFYANISNDGQTIISPTETIYTYSTRNAATSLGYTCTQSYGCNQYGPLVAYTQLPNKTQWNNEKLIEPGVRQIKNELGTNTTGNGEKTIVNFSYTGKAARLLTYQEVKVACSDAITGDFTRGQLDNCTFLLENTGKFTKTSETNLAGYFLETPKSSTFNSVWIIYGYSRNINGSYTNETTYGVRPVITIKITDIEQ